ncbi:type I-C CRISPR-associated protein Cas5 [Akkermansia glycaniphila]|uniref:type I-C CRISPR-associated protein Cas5c n=1 Tax=Akkermansia glycaniphila TaxID=1679444 RepID=UPI001C017ED2|nr:type I-C CRISPR-associated protein Cas5c [Akkermansia glycaniphila]MBT9450787.1 type I-C CRISPR-associated protein Cas5 [Akkermansia glycaniphila]
MTNQIEFKVYGRTALFSDPLTRMGGEKSSYPLPTYEALKGIVQSVYWKPTLTWFVDAVRVMRTIRTMPKNMKLLKYHESGADLAIYTYLVDVEYQVKAHFEWNMHRPDLAKDRIGRKHFEIAQRMLERGGRRDVFLGTRECQAYVEPCAFGEGEGSYDGMGSLTFGLMFHGFDYPSETGREWLSARFWNPLMCDGVVSFIRPEACSTKRDIRPMKALDVTSCGLDDVSLYDGRKEGR